MDRGARDEEVNPPIRILAERTDAILADLAVVMELPQARGALTKIFGEDVRR
jgi:hypothetical protein